MRSRYLLAVLIVAGMVLPSLAEEAPSKEVIDKLIEQMGSGIFTERESATQRLAVIGEPALEALHKAIKSGDAEIRKRAEEIIPQIEVQAENSRVLAPKRVHLVYKDTPLTEAVADFQKQSGYSLQLFDPQARLKGRKITLDTGETSFWHAFALFCDKAELMEPGMQDLNQRPQASVIPPWNGAPGMRAQAPRAGSFPVLVSQSRISMNGQLVLIDGKYRQLPTADHSAVRIRALDKANLIGHVPAREIVVPLEVSAEPRLQWQAFQTVRVEKAVDDQDQELTQIVPQVEGAVAFNGNMAIGLPGGGVAMQRTRFGDALSQPIPVQFKKGEKPAKTLKELRGTVKAQLLTEARPMITADKLDKADGKVFKGECGGSIKIVAVEAGPKQTMIRLEFEQPPYDRVVPAPQEAAQAVGIRAPLRMPAAKMAPGAPPGRLAPPVPNPALPQPAPPGAVQIQVGVGGGGPMRFVGPFNGLTVQDDKGNALPIQIQQTQFRVMPQGPGRRLPMLIYTFICPHDKDKGQPAKVVYLGRKRMTIEIPFALQDVPLP